MTTTTTTVQLRSPAGPNGFIFDEAVSGGGIFHWLGCHMVDVLLAVAGSRPAAVTALTATAGEAPVGVEDIASVSVRFEEGFLASLNYGYLQPTKTANPFGDDSPEPAIYGQQGWVRWNTGADVARAYSNDPRWIDSPWQLRQFSSPHEEGYGYAARLAMENFCDAIAGTAQPEYTIDQAMLVLQVIEAAYASAKSGSVSKIASNEAAAFV
jgi:predicted dehydrogenase